MGDWRKSSYSDGNGGQCVEVADTTRAVLVRDTTDRNGGTITFTGDAWNVFTATMKYQ